MSNDTQVQALPDWEHPLVQAAYKILCSDDKPPEGEHWEGFVARRITAAVASERDALAARVRELEGALSQISGMTYDSWTNGAIAQQIADAALTTPESKT